MSKGGGWFLLILFVFIIVAKTLNVVLYMLKVENIVVKIFFFLLPLLFVIVCSFFLDNKLYYALSMPSFRRYWLLFIGGYFTKRIFGIEIIKKKKNIIICSIGYISGALYYTLYVGGVTNNISFVVWLITNLFGCLFYLSLFEKISSKYRVPSVLIKIGQNTLGIYLLHYFFYYVYSTLIYPNLSEKLSLCISYFVMLFVTFLILLLTFLCVRILNRFSITSLFLFGKIQKKA